MSTDNAPVIGGLLGVACGILFLSTPFIIMEGIFQYNKSEYVKNSQWTREEPTPFNLPPDTVYVIDDIKDGYVLYHRPGYENYKNVDTFREFVRYNDYRVVNGQHAKDDNE